MAASCDNAIIRDTTESLVVDPLLLEISRIIMIPANHHDPVVRLGQPGVISSYRLDETALKACKVLKFDEYSENWLDFIISCRQGLDQTDYDIVIGGVANDRVFNTIELYIANLATKTETINRLKYEKPNLQICFRTQEIIDKYLQYEGCEQV